MTIEQKALELVNAGRYARQFAPVQYVSSALFFDLESALFAALEAREADKSRHAAELREQAERFSEAARKVVALISKIAENACLRSDYPLHSGNASNARLILSPFILAPDPLVEAIRETFPVSLAEVDEGNARDLRAALDARGLAIVKKEAVNG